MCVPLRRRRRSKSRKPPRWHRFLRVTMVFCQFFAHFRSANCKLLILLALLRGSCFTLAPYLPPPRREYFWLNRFVFRPYRNHRKSNETGEVIRPFLLFDIDGFIECNFAIRFFTKQGLGKAWKRIGVQVFVSVSLYAFSHAQNRALVK